MFRIRSIIVTQYLIVAHACISSNGSDAVCGVYISGCAFACNSEDKFARIRIARKYILLKLILKSYASIPELKLAFSNVVKRDEQLCLYPYSAIARWASAAAAMHISRIIRRFDIVRICYQNIINSAIHKYYIRSIAVIPEQKQPAEFFVVVIVDLFESHD